MTIQPQCPRGRVNQIWQYNNGFDNTNSTNKYKQTKNKNKQRQTIQTSPIFPTWESTKSDNTTTLIYYSDEKTVFLYFVHIIFDSWIKYQIQHFFSRRKKLCIFALKANIVFFETIFSLCLPFWVRVNVGERHKSPQRFTGSIFGTLSNSHKTDWFNSIKNIKNSEFKSPLLANPVMAIEKKSCETAKSNWDHSMLHICNSWVLPKVFGALSTKEKKRFVNF